MSHSGQGTARRFAVGVVGAGAALALAGCATTVSGVPSLATAAAGGSASAAARSSSPSGGSSSPASPTGPASDPATGPSSASGSSAPPSSGSVSGSGGSSTGTSLAARLQAAIADVRTAHVSLLTGAQGRGQTVRATGRERLRQGTLVAMDLTESLPGGIALRIVIVDKRVYVKLPTSLRGDARKPWLLASSASGNPTLKALADSLSGSNGSVSLNSVSIFATAAQSVTTLPPTRVDGVATTPYRVIVSAARLPSGPTRSALQSLGLRTLPVTLYLDSLGRPVRSSQQLSAHGQVISTVVDLTHYNEKVSITAPPASQVGTG